MDENEYLQKSYEKYKHNRNSETSRFWLYTILFTFITGIFYIILEIIEEPHIASMAFVLFFIYGVPILLLGFFLFIAMISISKK